MGRGCSREVKQEEGVGSVQQREAREEERWESEITQEAD